LAVREEHSPVRVLLAEDDVDVLDLTTYALRKYGHEVVCVTDGERAFERWQAGGTDLVLLDVNLPGLSGMDVCRKIREQSSTPIIMVTAMSDEEHIVRAFECGADDYLSKPISYKELAMRMRAVAQRTGGGSSVLNESTTASAAGITVDLDNFEVRLGGQPVRTTRLETRILYFLVCNAGRVLRSERLIELVWDYEGGDAFALKTHISHIRQKLGIAKGQPGYISSIPHVGYTLEKGESRA
jgi:DNA-binding response OmpR family regulator